MRSAKTAVICANLDRLEVYVGGAHFATLTPDRTGYPHLDYPPSFADFRPVETAADDSPYGRGIVND